MLTKEEVEAVRILGEKIGYGNMMSIATALWRRKLKDMKFPVSGAFVPSLISEETDKQSIKNYDEWIEKFYPTSP